MITEKSETDAIELLTKLVSIPSPSEHEAKAATYLAGWMNAHGLRAYVDEVGNAVGLKGSGAHEILLLGHIDTFAGEVPVRREGDILYGRGSVDAKGPLCTFAAAAAQAAVPDDWRLTVVGAVEEEGATSKGARHILAQRLDSANINDDNAFQYPRETRSPQPPVHLSPPTYCIIGEPSNWDRVTLGYKGRLLMDAVLRVPFSHSAGTGQLPAEQGVSLWQRVEEFCEAFNRVHQATTPFNRLEPSLRHIASQDAGAFGTVELSIGLRLPLGLTPVNLEQELRRMVQTVLPEGTSTKLEFSASELAYKGDKSNPLVRAFLKSIRAAGGQPRFVVKTGTADMNVVAPNWPNTPTIAYGPGDSSLDHTPNEHINLDEYLRAIEILQEVLEQLMSATDKIEKA